MKPISHRQYISDSNVPILNVALFLDKEAAYCLFWFMDSKAIGNAIRHRRKSRKITQYDLADIAEVSQRTVRDIEKGIANPELQTLMNVCSVLGMKIKIEVMRIPDSSVK